MPSQERLGNDKFLEALSTLFSSAHGSVFLTQKPLSEAEGSTAQVLIRATNGATTSKTSKKTKIGKTHKPKPKIKLATVVPSAELDSFYTKYADVCKQGMQGLRKRDKKKAKEKAKAAKKKKGNAAG